MIPSSNTTMEIDFARSLGAQASIHSARMFLTETTREAEIAMVREYAPRAAADLGTLRPNVVVFGCTSAGSLFGADYDSRLCAELGGLAGAPCIGIQTAVVGALDQVGGKRLAVLTPYGDDLTRATANAVSNGIRTVTIAAGMGIQENIRLADPTPLEIVEFARTALRSAHFDVLFVSCANFRALEARPMLESLLGVPVVTSNSAAIDAVARYLRPDVEPNAEGYAHAQ
jgi:maleate isomerase